MVSFGLWSQIAMKLFLGALGKSLHSWEPQFLHLGNVKKNPCFQYKKLCKKERDRVLKASLTSL